MDEHVNARFFSIGIQDGQIKVRVSQCFIALRKAMYQHTNTAFWRRHSDLSAMQFYLTLTSGKCWTFLCTLFPDLKRVGVFSMPTIAARFPIQNVDFHLTKRIQQYCFFFIV